MDAKFYEYMHATISDELIAEGVREEGYDVDTLADMLVESIIDAHEPDAYDLGIALAWSFFDDNRELFETAKV